MGATKAKGPLQRMIDREATAEATAPLVNDFRAANGDYQRNLRFVVNRGGTPLARWTSAGFLSDSQQAGINHCVHLWAKAGSQSVVVNFDRVRGQPHGDGYSQHEALTELARLKGWFPDGYWDVFERVCRFDEPAGVAGSRLMTNRASRETAARTVVCMIADIIADRCRLSY